ncbi:MAG: hypothetical protein WC080_01410 [Patescibacteria group bacterium]|jgi:hypothetical protein
MNLRELMDPIPRNPQSLPKIDVLTWFEKIVEYEAVASRLPADKVSDSDLEQLRGLQTAYKRVLIELCR